MYIYIACLPCCYCYYDLLFANLLIANIDSLSNLDDLVYTILGISTIPLAPAPTLAKLAKITPAASKLAKKEGLRRSKRTAGGNASRYTTDSGLTANKDNDNVYNRVYIPPTNIEEEEGGSGDNDGVNGSTSDSADKGEGGGIHKCGKGALRYKANIDSFSDLDDSVYTILAACKAKRRKSAKARAKAGRVVAAKCRKKRKKAAANTQASKLAKKEGLRRSKRIAGSNAGRYTTNSGLTANKDDNNAYNRAYMPPTDIEEEEGGSSNNNGVNSGTSDSADKGKGSSVYKYSKGASRYKDTLLYKRQYVTSYPYNPPSTPYADIYIYYI
ncbi:hypothetical protein P8C59_007629 [Phyllachora maydis]|uniref:Uncharacterized protein n=1 Tax=Phyllachora maydis TaxID=1825666 RepID=A0AAD9IA42_9PEZI|nr:hypothetical protein P8C59_007629 [Phyllachora maydis]